MRIKSIRTVLITVMMLTLPMGLKAAPTRGLGMWVWSSSSFSTQDGRQRLIRFCLKHDIRHLDVYTRITQVRDRAILQDAEAFRSLIAEAGQYHITIAGLRGNPKMFFPERQEQTLRELQAIIDFSKTLPQTASLKGIKYDVEPYCTAEWKTDKGSHQAIMTDYLSFLRKARSLLKEEAPGIWLAADIPFWWDKDEYRLSFEGTIKRFNEHIQDLTDFVVIMSYRRSIGKVLDCVEEERRYAGRIHKVIFPSLETVRLKEDAYVSFWGTPKEALMEVVPQLLKKTEGDPAVGGVMIHCYRSFAEMLKPDPTDRPTEAFGINSPPASLGSR